MLNYIVKHSASAARPLGILMLYYSGFGVLCSTIRRGADDELNTVISATLTGLLYRISNGWQQCLKGGAYGMGVGILASVVKPSSRENMKNIYQSITSSHY